MRRIALGVFDYRGNKLVDLYTNTCSFHGAAYDVEIKKELNGNKELSFTIPARILTEKGEWAENPRRAYLRNLMPICLTDMQFCDLAMVLDVFDGFYCGTTCLTLEMAYYHARLIGRPSVSWLAGLVNQEVADIGFDFQSIYGTTNDVTSL